MRKPGPGARERLLDAAERIAREIGPGSLSLDAVAQQAGVSKGGLLYHFPSKAKLLEAMVERFLASFDSALEEHARRNDGKRDSVVQAYLEFSLQEHRGHKPPPSGLLAALSENPELLNPVRRYERIFLDRMTANASDPTHALVVFLVIHGLRSMQLLNTEVITPQELEQVTEWLRRSTGAKGQA